MVFRCRLWSYGRCCAALLAWLLGLVALPAIGPELPTPDGAVVVILPADLEELPAQRRAELVAHPSQAPPAALSFSQLPAGDLRAPGLVVVCVIAYDYDGTHVQIRGYVGTSDPVNKWDPTGLWEIQASFGHALSDKESDTVFRLWRILGSPDQTGTPAGGTENWEAFRDAFVEENPNVNPDGNPIINGETYTIPEDYRQSAFLFTSGGDLSPLANQNRQQIGLIFQTQTALEEGEFQSRLVRQFGIVNPGTTAEEIVSREFGFREDFVDEVSRIDSSFTLDPEVRDAMRETQDAIAKALNSEGLRHLREVQRNVRGQTRMAGVGALLLGADVFFTFREFNDYRTRRSVERNLRQSAADNGFDVIEPSFGSVDYISGARGGSMLQGQHAFPIFILNERVGLRIATLDANSFGFALSTNPDLNRQVRARNRANAAARDRLVEQALGQITSDLTALEELFGFPLADPTGDAAFFRFLREAPVDD